MGESLLASSSFWRLSAILGVPWLVDAALKALLLSSHGLLPSVSPLSPYLPLLPYKDTGHCILG